MAFQQPLPCVTVSCSVVSLRRALCHWTISYADAKPLISFDSALQVSCAHTRGLFRCNCLSGLIVPGLFLLLEAPVPGSKRWMCACQLCFEWVSSRRTDRRVIASSEISIASVLEEEPTFCFLFFIKTEHLNG